MEAPAERTKDDRGEIVPRAPDKAAFKAILRKRPYAWAYFASLGGWLWTTGVFGMFIVLGGLTGPIREMSKAGELPGWFDVDWAIILAAVASVGVIVWSCATLQRRRAKLLHVCHACNTDLFGIEPDSDGCSVCPNCAAAWRLAWGHAGGGIASR